MKYYLMAFIPDKVGYVVFSPDFQEANTQGDTIDEAMEMAIDVLRITVEEYVKEGKKIPEPCDVETAKNVINGMLKDIDIKVYGEILYQYIPVATPNYSIGSVCVSMTKAELEEIDFKAKLYGLKRSRLLVAAARAYNPKSVV